MVTKQMTPVLSYTLRALSLGIFHFCISKPTKFISMGSCIALCYGLKNIHLHIKDDTFSMLT